MRKLLDADAPLIGVQNEAVPRTATAGRDGLVVVRLRTRRRRDIAVALHRMIARTPMPAPSTVQREAVSRSIVTVLAARAAWTVWSALAVRTIMRAVAALALLRLRVRLAAAGDERWQPLDVLFIIILEMLLARLTLLRVRLLVVLLLA
jgi:hypothetical protein